MVWAQLLSNPQQLLTCTLVKPVWVSADPLLQPAGLICWGEEIGLPLNKQKKGNSCLIIVNCKGKWKWIVDGEYRESETKTFVSSWASTIWAALSGKAGWFQENGEGQEFWMFTKLFRWKKWQTWILWHHHIRFLVARKMTLHGNGCVPFDLCLSYPVPSYP